MTTTMRHYAEVSEKVDLSKETSMEKSRTFSANADTTNNRLVLEYKEGLDNSKTLYLRRSDLPRIIQMLSLFQAELTNAENTIRREQEIVASIVHYDPESITSNIVQIQGVGN